VDARGPNHRTRAFPHLPIDSACVTAAPSQYNCLASRPCVLLPLAGGFGAAIAASRHMLQSDPLPQKALKRGGLSLSALAALIAGRALAEQV
jgi:hypothetical protein